jgi:uncharacterized protein (TIGR02284 family)
MADHTERQVLNHLVETCRDGERGFRYAANHVEAAAVKALFMEIAIQRERYAAELLAQAHRLGGTTESDGTVGGTLHRGWMTIKDSLGRHEDSAIIKEAERGEHAALAAYEAALQDLLPPDARDVVEKQCANVRHTYRRVQALLGPPQ